MVITIRFSGLL